MKLSQLTVKDEPVVVDGLISAMVRIIGKVEAFQEIVLSQSVRIRVIIGIEVMEVALEFIYFLTQAVFGLRGEQSRLAS